MTGHSARNMLMELAEKWRSHRATQAALAELNACDPAVVSEIAREARIDVAELRDIVARGTGSDQLMKRMMDAYGIDFDKVRAEVPNLMRDVAILCSKCDAKGRCRRELDAGTAADHADEFCPNHESFGQIAAGVA
jgi:hypothetical protein